MAATKRSFKRPFQPSISSYFGRSSTETDALSVPQPTIFDPSLPTTIQSSLLSVGMRIRKSVPEGYKTRPKTFCASAIPSSGDNTSFQTEPASNHAMNASTGLTELLPYCGILKVGGHDVQPLPAEDDLPPLQFDHEDWDLGFPPSQDTTSSNNSVVGPICFPIAERTSKRRREDADEEHLDVEAQPVSPRSRPVSHTPMPNLDSLRRIAVPKTRRKAVVQDENRESEMIDIGDFGEADFLEAI